MKEDPEPGAKCRDKFLVQSVIITPERESTPFPDLWFAIEKESKASIAEHKIRCVFLPTNSEDPNGPHSPPYLSQKSNFNPASPPVNNHTNRDDDDDPRFNSTRSHSAVRSNRSQALPSDLPTHDAADSTVYDLAIDSNLGGVRSARPSTTSVSNAVLKTRNSTHSHLSSSQLNDVQSPRPPSSIVSVNGTRGHPNSITSSASDDVQKLKSQLAGALTEIENLKALLSSRDTGLRKRSPTTSASPAIHSADMMSLETHGIQGPQGLVPVQTVVMISIGVFAFTWLFF